MTSYAEKHTNIQLKFIYIYIDNEKTTRNKKTNYKAPHTPSAILVFCLFVL